jgi:formylglycine-generating enzyme required for sulfatase activity
MQPIKLKKLDGKEWDARRKNRVELAQCGGLDALQQLLNHYWTWHFDESLAGIARLLLATDLSWERTPRELTPPVESLLSPLGHALDHGDMQIRDDALQILDSMIDVPAGEVLIGEELEPFQVDEFQIGRYPVTNAQYQRFIQETGHRTPKGWEAGAYPEKRGDHPVTWVNTEDAETYASWAGSRLPCFEEWQRAVRAEDDRLFPWGYEVDKPRCNTAELRAGGTTPVGAFPDGVSPFGCYDMLGNVWEWTSTWYDDNDPNFRVVCGGAWYYNHDHSTCISFDFFSKDYTEFVIGFRIAK